MFVYTPKAGASGSDEFTYSVSDGKDDSNIARVKIDIRSADKDRPPVASDLQLENARMTPITSRLVATDADDDDVTFRLVSKPSSGQVTMDPATGGFTGTPDPERRGGVDRFSYVASDGLKDSNLATVRIDMTNNADWWW